jgi:flagellar biosynthetic protein FliP
MRRGVYLILFLFFIVFLFSKVTLAQIPVPRITIGVEEAKGIKDVSLSLQLIAIITILTLAPSIIMMTTSFIRIVIVLSFVRQALTLAQVPPYQVVVGLSLFLTLFIMAPTLKEINTKALQPYFKGKLSFEEAFKKGLIPVRKFMFKQTRDKDLALFLKLTKLPRPKSRADVPTYVLIPAFMTSELTCAFKMGIILFLPFLVIDLIVASILMSMGMIMLPPAMISLPFKILLFILVDGWNLLLKSLILSF